VGIDGVGVTAQVIERDTAIVVRNRVAGSERQSPVVFRNRIFHRAKCCVRDAAVEMRFAMIGSAGHHFAKLIERFLRPAEAK